ncbi:MAG TPA: hypothetical protein VFA92_10900 [Candidatus Binatia bacterium]|nr:hypothetical protein [Candidatus Binatia bacterium]
MTWRTRAEVWRTSGFTGLTRTSAQTKELATSMAVYCQHRPWVPLSLPM